MASWNVRYELSGYQEIINKVLNQLKEKNIISRIWDKDYTVWSSNPAEISNRLGWLEIPGIDDDLIKTINTLVREIGGDGYIHGVLLGMGGSSMAPEVYRETFGIQKGYLNLSIVDTTDPDTIVEITKKIDATQTLFIVATKSGTTLETISLFKYLYKWQVEQVGKKEAGRHFIAITDPESPLADLAKQYNFRAIILNDPTVGGRYAALTYFGLLPAALMGIDIEFLLERSKEMIELCQLETVSENPAAMMGATIGALACQGCDKMTCIMSPVIKSFGYWLEQLVAESTGKFGKGIVPIVGEIPGNPSVYGDDRFFVSFQHGADKAYSETIQTLKHDDRPIIEISIDDIYDMGGLFFLWEMTTAVAGHVMGVTPFDQPDVEKSKILARKMMNDYMQNGILFRETPSLLADGITVYNGFDAKSPGETLNFFLQKALPGSYVAIQAFLTPGKSIEIKLNELRTAIRNQFHLATTLGFGPRYLHSTGQLHKGDAGRGMFIQLTADNQQDIFIPDLPGSDEASVTFGIVKSAQARGDRQALIDGGRQTIRFHLGKNALEGLELLKKAITDR